jgi:hypothetical protein
VLGRPPGKANDRIGYLPRRRNFAAGTRIRGVDIVKLEDREPFPLGKRERRAPLSLG